jgi:hypothetical protein
MPDLDKKAVIVFASPRLSQIEALASVRKIGYHVGYPTVV